jgi:hypothetical protein
MALDSAQVAIIQGCSRRAVAISDYAIQQRFPYPPLTSGCHVEQRPDKNFSGLTPKRGIYHIASCARVRIGIRGLSSLNIMLESREGYESSTGACAELLRAGGFT